jgi:hypothetical protein
LVNVNNFLWADGSRVYIPSNYDDDYKDGIIININENDRILTVSDPSVHLWEYTYYDYIKECKKSRSWEKKMNEIRYKMENKRKVDIFIDNIFEDII